MRITIKQNMINGVTRINALVVADFVFHFLHSLSPKMESKKPKGIPNISNSQFMFFTFLQFQLMRQNGVYISHTAPSLQTQ